jgi:hypothetical protein
MEIIPYILINNDYDYDKIKQHPRQGNYSQDRKNT